MIDTPIWYCMHICWCDALLSILYILLWSHTANITCDQHIRRTCDSTWREWHNFVKRIRENFILYIPLYLMHNMKRYINISRCNSFGDIFHTRYVWIISRIKKLLEYAFYMYITVSGTEKYYLMKKGIPCFGPIKTITF